MKTADIKLGSIYLANVTNRVVQVRIDKENSSGGWDATNLATKKKIRIKTARRLRPNSGPMKIIIGAEQENDSAGSARKASKDGEIAKSEGKAAATTPKTKKQVTTTAKPAKNAKNASNAKAGKRMGILDAAAQILVKAKKPMACKAIVDQAIAKELWTTSGKTPHATLYAAIIREISKKGTESRFEKVDRGHFRARKGA